LINNDIRYFSTKEKAEEYILLNKTVLSLKEVWDIINNVSGVSKPSMKQRSDKLKDLVKSKIKQSV